MELKKKILSILEKDAKLSSDEIAVMLNLEKSKVAEAIEEMENEKIIFGTKTLINWDKVEDGKVTAYIELNVTPEQGLGFEKVAEDIIREFPQVSSVSLMSGGFDILVELEGYSMKDVALFVAEKIAPMPNVISTKTHFVLRRYKHGGVVLNKEEIDERRVISF
ncbi:MAG: Lrp/AsnC family transcriptional regulator [Ruminococcaceae bacterium]|nr:Lrp/AsnC family transcriptional regulator [Oscillospiraceae bacterium]